MTTQTVYAVFSPSNDENEETLHAVFSTKAKAEEYIKAEFDPEDEEERKPYSTAFYLDPTPEPKTWVTVWHTCINVQTGQFGEKGTPSRVLTGTVKDVDQITTTTYNLGYANAYSHKSAADSIRRAQALRRRTLKGKAA